MYTSVDSVQAKTNIRLPIRERINARISLNYIILRQLKWFAGFLRTDDNLKATQVKVILTSLPGMYIYSTKVCGKYRFGSGKGLGIVEGNPRDVTFN